MRIFALAFGLLLVAPTASLADEIQDVIGDQLKAFNDRDILEAWQFASPMIQGLFIDPRNFGAMVEQGYPMVWTNTETRFLERRDMGGRPIQRVLVKDADGGIHVLEYEMVETPDGWKINGVRVLPAPELGV